MEAQVRQACPWECARYKTYGQCVHNNLDLSDGDAVLQRQLQQLEKLVSKEKFELAAKEIKTAKYTRVLDTRRAAEEADPPKWRYTDLYKRLPIRNGVYVWVGQEDVCLYVGSCADLRRRHYTHNGINSYTRGDLQVTKLIWWCSLSEQAKLEMQLQDEFQPALVSMEHTIPPQVVTIERLNKVLDNVLRGFVELSC